MNSIHGVHLYLYEELRSCQKLVKIKHQSEYSFSDLSQISSSKITTQVLLYSE